MRKWLKKTICKIFFNPKFIGNDEFFDLMDEITKFSLTTAGLINFIWRSI